MKRRGVMSNSIKMALLVFAVLSLGAVATVTREEFNALERRVQRCGAEIGLLKSQPSRLSKKSETGRPVGSLSWDEAAKHVGEYVTVEGRVVSTHYASTTRGQPTFLNIGKPYPDKDRFTVVIWGRNRGKFEGVPEDTYRGKLIRVTGTINLYAGTPQIEAQSQDQIEVVK